MTEARLAGQGGEQRVCVTRLPVHGVGRAMSTCVEVRWHTRTPQVVRFASSEHRAQTHPGSHS